MAKKKRTRPPDDLAVLRPATRLYGAWVFMIDRAPAPPPEPDRPVGPPRYPENSPPANAPAEEKA